MNDRDAPNGNGIQTDISPLLHVVGNHGKDLVCIEVGTNRGISTCDMLYHCHNIKEMHCVDMWEPYDDFIGSPNGEPVYSLNKMDARINEAVARISLEEHPFGEKVVIHHMDSNECAKQFPDEHFDFIFLDTYLTNDQIANDLQVWYPKVKVGGLFTGHDWFYSPLQEIVHSYRKHVNTDSNLMAYSNCFSWIKDKSV